MRYKQNIERALDECENLVQILEQEVQSGKPHVTKEYVAQMIRTVDSKLATAKQYLRLEDE